MAEVGTVNYDSDRKTYYAVLSDGQEIILKSNNLRAAELEAERIAEQVSFASFVAPRTE